MSARLEYAIADRTFSHIHVSLRDANGKSLFAVSDAELKTGRAGATNGEVKFISQEGEWFLAGVLDGLPDSELNFVARAKMWG